MTDESPITDEQVAELRRLAEQATPGPWQVAPGNEVIETQTTCGSVCEVLTNYDCAYIAATNPTTILSLLDALEALKERAEQAERTWRCFHCGFETADPKEAAAHFGDGDGHPAICVWWTDLAVDDRLKVYQQLEQELHWTRDELHSAEGHLQAISQSFSKIGGAKNDTEAWQKYDVMEGRALAAEERAAALDAAAQQVINRKFSTHRARNGRHVGIEADDGEKCWIVHSDDIFALEAALSPTPPTTSQDTQQGEKA